MAVFVCKGSKKGHIAAAPDFLYGSDGEAEAEVANRVVVLLDVLGVCRACATGRHLVEPGVPAATTACGGSAGCPCGTHVGLADQIVDLHGGGLAGQARECPAVATCNGFGLGFCECFELDHLVRDECNGLGPICVYNLLRQLLVIQLKCSTSDVVASLSKMFLAVFSVFFVFAAHPSLISVSSSFFLQTLYHSGGGSWAFCLFTSDLMTLLLLQDASAELVTGGGHSYTFDFSKDYSVRQRAYSTAQYSNNFTNNYQSFNGGGNLYAFGSILG